MNKMIKTTIDKDKAITIICLLTMFALGFVVAELVNSIGHKHHSHIQIQDHENFRRGSSNGQYEDTDRREQRRLKQQINDWNA